MKYLLLRKNIANSEIVIKNPDGNYEFVIEKLNPFSSDFKGLLSNIYWSSISKKSWIAFLRNKQDNKILCYTYVLGKSYKFPFMDKSDLQIGPAFTLPAYRRLGLFRYLATNVIAFFQNKGYSLIALVRPENTASLNCLLSIGFFVEKNCWKNKAKIYHFID